MWNRLLDLFKKNEEPKVEVVPEESPEQFDTSSVDSSNHGPGRSVNLGYNYLKGLDGDYEDSSKHIRRFINLNRLLRGDYNGKIEADYEDEESDIRGEDSK